MEGHPSAIKVPQDKVLVKEIDHFEAQWRISFDYLTLHEQGLAGIYTPPGDIGDPEAKAMANTKAETQTKEKVKALQQQQVDG